MTRELSSCRLTPTIGAIPNSFAACTKRITPPSESRSVIASAGAPNCAARAIKSRGCVVPYLKENALATERWLNNPYQPLTCRFIAFEFESCNCSNGRRLNAPDRTRIVIRPIDPIANSVPPTACFAPSIEDVMDAETFSTVGELNRSGSVGAYW